MRIENRTIALAAVCLLPIIQGCNLPMPQAAPPAPRPVLNLHFTPPASAPPGSAKVTLALVQPEWAADSGGNLEAFSTAMKNDFMALLNARGYATRGPFDSYQAMVYPDKVGTDLVLLPQLQIDWDFSDAEFVRNGGFLAQLAPGAETVYSLDGTVVIRGRLNLLLSESMTDERMWSKSIAIAPISVAFTGQTKLSLLPAQVQTLPPGAVQQIALRDPGFDAAVYPKLEAMYQTVLQECWAYLDPRELQMVKAEAAPLRRRLP
jgi:hypothetical protein